MNNIGAIIRIAPLARLFLLILALVPSAISAAKPHSDQTTNSYLTSRHSDER